MSDSGKDWVATVRGEFRTIGGDFVLPPEQLAVNLDSRKALVFDWDGVFNAGKKGSESESGFSEVDSMGTNMLRYGFWRRSAKLPVTAIISGENNASATGFAEREHFTAVYTGIRDKRAAIEHLCKSEDITPAEIICVFDDINDLAMAGLCGTRLMVRRAASPLLAAYVKERSLCDYVSGAEAGNNAVREMCEMLLGLMGSYDDVLDSRSANDAEYQAYFTARQACVTRRFNGRGATIEAA